MILKYQSTLIEKMQLSERVWKLSFTRPDDPWTFTAGQYMLFHIDAPQGKGIRQYSIASTPSKRGQLDFIIEFVEHGLAGIALNSMLVGETLTLQGPAGVFTFQNPQRPVIFLATGTGIAPIYSIIKDRIEHSHSLPLLLFWGFRYMEDTYFIDDLTALQNQSPLFHFNVCLSREDMNTGGSQVEQCLKGRVNQCLEEYLNKQGLSIADFDYYLCGSKHIVDSLRQYLSDKHVTKDHIFFEKFTI